MVKYTIIGKENGVLFAHVMSINDTEKSKEFMRVLFAGLVEELVILSENPEQETFNPKVSATDLLNILATKPAHFHESGRVPSLNITFSVPFIKVSDDEAKEYAHKLVQTMNKIGYHVNRIFADKSDKNVRSAFDVAIKAQKSHAKPHVKHVADIVEIVATHLEMMEMNAVPRMSVGGSNKPVTSILKTKLYNHLKRADPTLTDKQIRVQYTERHSSIIVNLYVTDAQEEKFKLDPIYQAGDSGDTFITKLANDIYNKEIKNLVPAGEVGGIWGQVWPRNRMPAPRPTPAARRQQQQQELEEEARYRYEAMERERHRAQLAIPLYVGPVPSPQYAAQSPQPLYSQGPGYAAQSPQPPPFSPEYGGQVYQSPQYAAQSPRYAGQSPRYAVQSPQYAGQSPSERSRFSRPSSASSGIPVQQYEDEDDDEDEDDE